MMMMGDGKGERDEKKNEKWTHDVASDVTTVPTIL